MNIRRRQQDAAPDEGYRINNRIRAQKVRVIDPNGEQLGILSIEDARQSADEFGFDLVEVSADADPPVCRIMDYGKYKYQRSKKQRSKTSRVELKEFRLRPNIGDHDLDVKLKAASEALDKGNNVRFVMRLRGRERAHTSLWVEKVNEIAIQLTKLVERATKVTQTARSNGNMIISQVECA